MSSYHRRHHGQPRPPPARNRPGHHTPSMPHQATVYPHYLLYLCSQAAHLHCQISALSGQNHVTPITTIPNCYSYHTSPFPYQETSTRPSTKRDPEREKAPSGDIMQWKTASKAMTFTRHGTKLTHTSGTQQLSTSSQVAFARDLINMRILGTSYLVYKNLTSHLWM